MRQKIVPGDILEIDLANGSFCYGRVLRDKIGFYELQESARPSVEELVSRPILFKVWVMDYAIKKGIWKVIGHSPLSDELMSRPYFFKKDIISGKLSKTREGDQEFPTTLDECEDLECAAVWDPEHVEQRLRDHFAGVPNGIYERMRP